MQTKFILYKNTFLTRKTPICIYTPQNSIQRSMGSQKEIRFAGFFTDSHYVIVYHAVLLRLSSVWTNFCGAWSERFMNVTEDVQPTVKEQLEAQIDNLVGMNKR